MTRLFAEKANPFFCICLVCFFLEGKGHVVPYSAGELLRANGEEIKVVDWSNKLL